MSSEHAIPSSARERPASQRSAAVALSAAIAGIIIVIALAVVGVHVIAQLDSMAANLARVNTSLGTLKTMNRKLDVLNSVSVTLHQMNDKLAVTNTYLAVATQRLSSMASDSKAAGSSLIRMSGTLAHMQSDIHTMSHKISGSFLFRSIK